MACETNISITQEVFSTSGNATAHSVLPISDGGLKCFLNYIYVSEHTAEAESLLMELGKIPAPPPATKTDGQSSAGTGCFFREQKMWRSIRSKMSYAESTVTIRMI